MTKFSALLILIVSSSIIAADYAPIEKGKALESLKQAIAPALKAEKKPEAFVTLFGSLQNAEIVASDEKKITVRVKEQQFDLMWDKIEPAEVVSMAQVCVEGSGPGTLVLFDYCLATQQYVRAKQALERVYKYPNPDRKAIEDRSAALKTAESPVTVANQVAAQTSAAAAAGAGPYPAPAKITFESSETGKLRPVKEVAAAIDNAIEIDLADMGIHPEPVCDDCAFLRRASLDLTGQIPTGEEAIEFYNSPKPEKRAEKIQELLKRPEYTEHWATFWEVLLVGRHTRDDADVNTGKLKTWLREEFAKNEPYDKMVTELLTASGDNDKSGPVNYLTHHLNDTLPNTVAHLSQTFLGARIGCAQCHDHPFDKWTQQDFWGFTAFLADTRSDRKQLYEDPKDPKKVTKAWQVLIDQNDRRGDSRYDPPSKDLYLPAKPLDGPVFNVSYSPSDKGDKGDKKALPKNFVDDNKKDAAKGMDGKDMMGKDAGMMGGDMGMKKDKSKGDKNDKAVDATGQRLRQGLASWITDQNNEKFVQSACNRVWRQMFGYGLVEPVDDIRPKNPPSHPEVMRILATEFNACGRDFKRLMTIIASTKAYQRSASGQATKADRLNAVRYGARAEVRPMTPEMLLMAIEKACGGEDKVKSLIDGLKKRDLTDPYKRNETADPHINDYFNLMQRFINTSTAEDRAGKLQFEGTVAQALMMMHSDTISKGIRDAVLRFKAKDQNNLISIFATTLGRPPSEVEVRAFTAFGGNMESVMWVLLNSAEFVTIH